MSSSRLSRKLLAFTTLVPGLIAMLIALACGLPPPAPPVGAAEDYLLCFWNVENLFDDQTNEKLREPDATYDAWFAGNAEDRKEKYDHLSKALVEMNDGKGPDILVAVEVESERAAELLRDATNARLHDPALHYTHILFKEVRVGRHIAPVIISRLPASDAKQLDKKYRILEGHITVGDHDLVILASHWTSRVTDEEGSRRDEYGNKLYGRFREIYTANPKVDLLVCGDFNDPPDDESVEKHLHAIGDRQKVLADRDPPLMLNLFRNFDAAAHGTHYDAGRWIIFDQITVSPGLLDQEGWSCETDTASVVNTLIKSGDKHKRPWRFGNQKDKADRGYSDHFPVTVRLKVNP